jgi:hypothetical protein
MFGTSMLFPGLLPPILTGMILAADGGVLLYLLHILILLENMAAAAVESPNTGETARISQSPGS